MTKDEYMHEHQLNKTDHLDLSKKSFEVWSEGYSIQGGNSGASFHGIFEGYEFRDAVIAYRDTVEDKYSYDCIDIDRLTNWGCKFYDNAKDACESFG